MGAGRIVSFLLSGVKFYIISTIDSPAEKVVTSSLPQVHAKGYLKECTPGHKHGHWKGHTMKFQKIVTLSLNPTLDISLWLSDFQLGRENPVQNCQYQAAGKAVNLSRTFSHCGVDTTAIIAAGRKNAMKFLECLPQDHIRRRVVYYEGAIRENISLVIPGQPLTRLMDTGSPVPQGALEKIMEMLRQEVTPDTLLMLSGKLPKDMPGEEFVRICQQGREWGATLALDTSSLTLQEVCQIRPWLFKPNLQEFCALTDCPCQEQVEWNPLLAAVEKLAPAHVEHLLLSLGEQGLYYQGQGKRLWVQVPEVQVRSAVGAGDNLLAGFVLGMRQGMDLEQTLRLAAAFGTAACLVDGTNPPNLQEVQDLLPQIQLRGISL